MTEFSAHIDPTDVDPIILDQQLVTISEDIYKTPIYGKTAASVLARERAGSDFYVCNFPDSIYPRGDALFIGGLVGFSGSAQELGQPDQSFAELAANVNNFLDNSSLPFDFHLSPSDQKDIDDTGRRYHLYGTPLHPGKQRLAHYMVAHSLADNVLHGTLGKAVDILNVAAGGAEPQVTDEVEPSQFISWGAVFDQIDSEYPKFKKYGVRQGVADKIRGMLFRQLHYGKPDKTGELVIEGPHDHNDQRWSQERKITQLVLRSSLPNLASQFHSSNSPIPVILQKIANSEA